MAVPFGRRRAGLQAEEGASVGGDARSVPSVSKLSREMNRLKSG
jgi:hypothetical protein